LKREFNKITKTCSTQRGKIISISIYSQHGLPVERSTRQYFTNITVSLLC